MSITLEEAREQIRLECRIDKIKQKLFWYDNVPEDDEIVKLMMEWWECRQELKEMGVSTRYLE